MSNIVQNIQELYKKIRAAEVKYQRKPNSVSLLAVSKTRSVVEITEAASAGQLAFGENYVQEALPKIVALVDAEKKLVWHFIGKVQSNKTKFLAQHFDWVESVAKQEHANFLNKYRPANLPALNVCIEFNVSAERTKGGVAQEDLVQLASYIVALPRLCLRGLMVIPAPEHDFARQYAVFSEVAKVWRDLNAQGFHMDTLSMGMTDDFEAAIAAGSTEVRIGTAIFGPRVPK